MDSACRNHRSFHHSIHKLIGHLSFFVLNFGELLEDENCILFLGLDSKVFQLLLCPILENAQLLFYLIWNLLNFLCELYSVLHVFPVLCWRILLCCLIRNQLRCYQICIFLCCNEVSFAELLDWVTHGLQLTVLAS